jgi:hypothetical protein
MDYRGIIGGGNGMTREQILAMKPGRELDELMAEKVMGWKRDFQCWKDQNGRIRTIESTSFGSFQPSTDISAAWEVANKFDFFYLFRNPHIYDGEWECKLVAEDSSRKYYALGKTAPEAICKAALLTTL